MKPSQTLQHTEAVMSSYSTLRDKVAELQAELAEVRERNHKRNNDIQKEWGRLQDENAELKTELERERIRLAACGSAALGYYDGCNDEYKSASLDDVLRLLKDAERYNKLWAMKSISLIIAFFGNGCVNKCRKDVEAMIDAAMKEAQ